VAGFIEHGNEPAGSTEDVTFLDQLSECQLLKQDCTPWTEFDL
jgi:hypothetical protein